MYVNWANLRHFQSFAITWRATKIHAKYAKWTWVSMHLIHICAATKESFAVITVQINLRPPQHWSSIWKTYMKIISFSIVVNCVRNIFPCKYSRNTIWNHTMNHPSTQVHSFVKSVTSHLQTKEIWKFTWSCTIRRDVSIFTWIWPKHKFCL